MSIAGCYVYGGTVCVDSILLSYPDIVDDRRGNGMIWTSKAHSEQADIYTHHSPISGWAVDFQCWVSLTSCGWNAKFINKHRFMEFKWSLSKYYLAITQNHNHSINTPRCISFDFRRSVPKDAATFSISAIHLNSSASKWTWRMRTDEVLAQRPQSFVEMFEEVVDVESRLDQLSVRSSGVIVHVSSLLATEVVVL